MKVHPPMNQTQKWQMQQSPALNCFIKVERTDFTCLLKVLGPCPNQNRCQTLSFAELCTPSSALAAWESPRRITSPKLLGSKQLQWASPNFRWTFVGIIQTGQLQNVSGLLLCCCCTLCNCCLELLSQWWCCPPNLLQVKASFLQSLLTKQSFLFLNK